jgi:hypothetical protein
MTTATLSLTDQLKELGSLADNTETPVQRVGARQVEHFLNTYSSNYQPDLETTANILYFLTDIQVRDYALGLMDAKNGDKLIPALEYLLESAPTNSKYINAPAGLLAALHFEMGNTDDALLTLSNARDDYSLAKLLHRVFKAGWAPESFTAMRAELHPKVTEGIFGRESE